MKNLKNLGEVLSKETQKTINGGIGNACGIFVCMGPSTEGCCCYDNPNSVDGRGTCFNGMCCD